MNVVAKRHAPLRLVWQACEDKRMVLGVMSRVSLDQRLNRN
jgi:hypothetical protein